jgi:hypothetical protein
MDPDSSQIPPENIPDTVEPTPPPEPATSEPIEPPTAEATTVPPESVEPITSAPEPTPISAQNEVLQAPAVTISTSASEPFDPHSVDEINFVKTVLNPKAVAARKARVAKHLDDIVAQAREKGGIDHTEVCLLTKSAKSTATRYLTTLVRQGRLMREGGRKHRDVIYHAV